MVKINPKKREKILLTVTGIIAILVIFYQLGFSKLYERLTQTSGELATEKKQFTEYISQFAKKAEIERDFTDIESQFPPASANKKPAQQFSEDVDYLCKLYGFNAPNIQPAKDELIANVDDYKFITLTVIVEGPIKNIAQLLKGFHEKALLITELTLTATRDQDRITATVTAARIAKLTPEDRDRLKKRGKTGESGKTSTVGRRFRF